MCSYLEALKKHNACESCFAYKVGYVNSSDFWWNLCFLFCLYSILIYWKYLFHYLWTCYSYLFSGYSKISEYVFWNLPMLEAKVKGNKRSSDSFVCQPVCSWLHCYGNYFLWFCHHFPMLKCLYTVSSNDIRKLFLVVSERRMRDNSNKLNEVASRWKRKAMDNQIKLKISPNTLRVIEY